MMLGLAQQLFVERHGKQPWKIEASTQPKTSWPLLDEMMSAKRLNEIDLALAKKLLAYTHSQDEASIALICHLSMAARQGHLCVTIENNQIIPPPEEVWLSTEENSQFQSISQASWSTLHSLLIEAVQSPDESWLSVVENNAKIVNTPLCCHQNRYYLQRYWILESQFVTHVAPFLNESTPQLQPNMIQINNAVKELIKSKALLPEQGQGILNGCQYPLTVITGGPGTGKTHTAGILLRTFLESLTTEQRKQCRIALAAPTGKAAANLALSIQRALKGQNDFPPLTAQTLHTLLGIQKGISARPMRLLDIDLLLVDESSMIDVQVMGRLISSLKPGTRLILIGDRYQLPSVEAGSLFADLVNYLQSSPTTISRVTELKTCLRAEMKDLIDLAEKVNRGEKFTIPANQSLSQKDCINFVQFDSNSHPKVIQQRLLRETQSRFPTIHHIPDHPLEILKQFSQFRILTPLRRGPLGTEQLNSLFAAAAISHSQHAICTVMPIMITRNNPSQELFNGEMGLIVKFNREMAVRNDHQDDFALFPSKKENGLPEENVRKIPAILLPPFEYAYCISIHKSQGSEFNYVLMLLPEGSETFGREALYTGITRARQNLEIWSSSSILNKMISHTALRHSGVIQRLQGIL